MPDRPDLTDIAERLRESGEWSVTTAEIRALLDRLLALETFVAAFNICDGNRGRFSCTPAHDCRCTKDRKISDPCTCGGDALEAARAALEVPHA